MAMPVMIPRCLMQQLCENLELERPSWSLPLQQQPSLPASNDAAMMRRMAKPPTLFIIV